MVGNFSARLTAKQDLLRARQENATYVKFLEYVTADPPNPGVALFTPSEFIGWRGYPPALSASLPRAGGPANRGRAHQGLAHRPAQQPASTATMGSEPGSAMHNRREALDAKSKPDLSAYFTGMMRGPAAPAAGAPPVAPGFSAADRQRQADQARGRGRGRGGGGRGAGSGGGAGAGAGGPAKGNVGRGGGGAKRGPQPRNEWGRKAHPQRRRRGPNPYFQRRSAPAPVRAPTPPPSGPGTNDDVWPILK